VALALVCSLAAAAPASGRPPHRVHRAQSSPAALLAPTPYMGWDTYLGLGGRFSESTVLEQASQLIRLGLARQGYRYVWLDAGWWRGTRDAQGRIEVNAAQWPHGIAWLASTLHHAGLRLGLYTDAGRNGCGGAGQGSYGHYQQDVDTFAAWGVDAVKVDFCGGIEMGLRPASAYAGVHAAIEHSASGRPMLLSICNFLQPGQYGGERPLIGESAFASYMFGPSLGTSWRTDTDVGFPGDVSFAEVLRNMDADAAAPQAAGPGHWNDPDYLAPDQGLSSTQFRTQISMWAVLAAPLMISDDLTRIHGSSLAAVSNSEVIAIDQDAAAVQGRLVSAAGAGEVWVRPLLGGALAVALLNRGYSWRTVTTNAAAVGLPAACAYSVRDVWRHTTGVSAGTFSARVPPNGTVLLRVRPR
jgi:alpha-galactosidase